MDPGKVEIKVFTKRSLGSHAASGCPFCQQPIESGYVGARILRFVKVYARWAHLECARKCLDEPAVQRTPLLEISERITRGNGCLYCQTKDAGPMLRITISTGQKIRLTLCRACLENVVLHPAAGTEKKALIMAAARIRQVLDSPFTRFEFLPDRIIIQCEALGYQSAIHWNQLHLSLPLYPLGVEGRILWPRSSLILSELVKMELLGGIRERFKSMFAVSSFPLGRPLFEFWSPDSFFLSIPDILSIYKQTNLKTPAMAVSTQGPFRFSRVFRVPSDQLILFLASDCYVSRQAARFRLLLEEARNAPRDHFPSGFQYEWKDRGQFIHDLKVATEQTSPVAVRHWLDICATY